MTESRNALTGMKWIQTQARPFGCKTRQLGRNALTGMKWIQTTTNHRRDTR